MNRRMGVWDRMFFRSLSAIFLTLSGLMFVSCQSSEGGPDGRVVSKSSNVRPPWVSKGLHLSESRRVGLSSYAKSRVKILELGIKQAQLEASTQATRSFDQDFAQFVVEFVRENEVQKDKLPEGSKVIRPPSKDDVQWWNGLNQAAREASSRFPAPVLETDGVYWEEVERIEPAPEGGQDVVRDYSIYVPVRFEASTLISRISYLLEQLRASERFRAAVDILETNLESLEPPSNETPVDRKEVESIQTEMDSTGAEIDSDLEKKGPRGRKLAPSGDSD